MAKETIVEDNLLKDITEFCTLNEMDTTIFINKLLRDAYMEFKWLDKRPTPTTKPQIEEEKKEIKTENPIEAPEPKKFFGDSKNRDMYGE